MRKLFIGSLVLGMLALWATRSSAQDRQRQPHKGSQAVGFEVGAGDGVVLALLVDPELALAVVPFEDFARGKGGCARSVELTGEAAALMAMTRGALRICL